MPAANRTFSSTPQKQPGIANFNPGGDDFSVIRIIDGHAPFCDGLEGTNEHQPTAGSPEWDDAVSQYDC